MLFESLVVIILEIKEKNRHPIFFKEYSIGDMELSEIQKMEHFDMGRSFPKANQTFMGM